MRNLLKDVIRKVFVRYIWKYVLLNKIRKQKGPLKLNLGAGKNPLEGWINADFIPENKNILFIDVRKKIPFKDNTFDYIIQEHLIEHLSRRDGENMLKECFRILKSGGKLRIATPDLIFISSLYNKNRDNNYYIKKITQRFLKDLGKDYRPAFVINNAFYNWGHKFLYDEKLLTELLEKVGFKEIVRKEYGKSNDKNLDGVEMHEKGVRDFRVCQIESLILESKKHKSP